MQPFTVTLPFAGRIVTVRELTAVEFRHLLFDEEITAEAKAADAAAADSSTAPVADEAPASIEKVADDFMAQWIKSHLDQQGMTHALISAMSTAEPADFMQARFSEIDALITKIKTLNSRFFALFQRQAPAPEPTFGVDTAKPLPTAPTPPPELPRISASASSDPLLHSLEQVIQAHGATATSSLSPPSTNSSTA